MWGDDEATLKMGFGHLSLFAAPVLNCAPAMTFFIAFPPKYSCFFPCYLFPTLSSFLYPTDQMLPTRDYNWNLPLAEQPLDILVKISPAPTWSLVSIPQDVALVRVERTGKRHVSHWYSFQLLHEDTFFFFTFMFFINLFYLFLAVLGLRCCTRAFSSCSERGLLFVAVRGLLIAVASLVAEHGL